MGKKLITVDQNGKGDYYYIQDAIDSLPPENDGMMILVREGIYYEKLVVNKPEVTLVGEPGKNVSVVFDDFAGEDAAGPRYSTASIWIAADGFSAENIIFVNSAEVAEDTTQTVAVYISGDQAQFHHCGFLGRLDTVVTAPKPLQFAAGSPTRLSRQYFRCCYFEGGMNILSGCSTAVFEYCKIHSLGTFSKKNGYVAMPSRMAGQTYGFVFRHCIFTGEAPAMSTYLVSTKNLPKIVFLECRMEEHLHPEGWDEPRDGADGSSFGNVGPAGNLLAVPPGIRILSSGEASSLTLETIFTDATWCIGTPEYEAKKRERAS